MNASVQSQLEKDWVFVCHEQDLIPQIGVCAKVNEHQVAIFKIQQPDGSQALHAIDNHDPMSNANVLSRGLVGDLKGRPVVASPIYKHHFDLETGECLEEPVQIPVYPVRSINGTIEVQAGGR